MIQSNQVLDELIAFLIEELPQEFQPEDVQEEIQSIVRRLNNSQDVLKQFKKQILRNFGIRGTELINLTKGFTNTRFYKIKSQQRQIIPTIDFQRILLNELHQDRQIILRQSYQEQTKTACVECDLYDMIIKSMVLQNQSLKEEWTKLTKLDFTSIKITSIKQSAKNLKTRIQAQKRMNEKVTQSLANIQNERGNLLDHFITIKKQLNVIDMLDLERLINKTKQAQQSVKDKSIILFIGETGAGKTTTILSLLGFKMQKKKFKGMTWVTTAENLTDEKIRLLYTSPQQKSITRYPLAIRPKQKLDPREQIWFVDTPAFGDRARCEVDLANGIGTINVITNCKYVRPVIITCSYSWGTKGNGLRNLRNLLGNIFSVYQQVKDSITFIFNRFTTDRLDQLNPRFKDMLTNVDRYDQNLINLCQDLVEKTQYKDDIINFDPLYEGQYKKVIRKILKSKKLKNPAQYFNIAFTQQTINNIKNQCNILDRIIKYKFNNNDLQHATYYLKNFKKMKELIPTEVPKMQYSKTSKQIEKSINQKFKKYLNEFNNKIKSKTLQENDIIEHKNKIQQLKKYHKLFNEFMKIPDSKIFYDQVLQQANKLIRKIESSNQISKTLKIAGILLKNFKLNKLNQIPNILKQGLQRFQNEYENLLKQKQYHKCAEIYNEYEELLKIQYQYKDKKYEKVQNLLVMKLPNLIKEEVEKLKLSSNKIDQKKCSKWSELEKDFINIKTCYSLMGIHENIQLQDKISQFKNILIKKGMIFTQSLKIIINDLKQNGLDEIENIEQKFRQLNLLKQITCVRIQIESQMQECMENYKNIYSEKSTLKQLENLKQQMHNNITNSYDYLKFPSSIQHKNELINQNQQKISKLFKKPRNIQILINQINELLKTQNKQQIIKLNSSISKYIKNIYEDIKTIPKISGILSAYKVGIYDFFGKISEGNSFKYFKQYTQKIANLIQEKMDRYNTQITRLLTKKSSSTRDIFNQLKQIYKIIIQGYTYLTKQIYNNQVIKIKFYKKFEHATNIIFSQYRKQVSIMQSISNQQVAKQKVVDAFDILDKIEGNFQYMRQFYCQNKENDRIKQILQSDQFNISKYKQNFRRDFLKRIDYFKNLNFNQLLNEDNNGYIEQKFKTIKENLKYIENYQDIYQKYNKKKKYHNQNKKYYEECEETIKQKINALNKQGLLILHNQFLNPSQILQRLLQFLIICQKKFYFDNKTISNQYQENLKIKLHQSIKQVNYCISQIRQFQFRKFRFNEFRNTDEEMKKCIIQQKRIKVARILIRIKAFSLNVSYFSDICRQEIDNIVKAYQRLGEKQINQLAYILDIDKSESAKRLLQQIKCFQNYRLIEFKRKMPNTGVEYVLDNLGFQNYNKNKLKRKYQQYIAVYNRNIQIYKQRADHQTHQTHQTIEDLISNIKCCSARVKYDLKNQKNHEGHQLIALIFALWSILKANINEEDQLNYVYVPHPAQIIAIFCILGIGDKKQIMVNRLAQVKTREGKSLILAGLSAYFGCLGYQVSCACYSKYLSQRDANQFAVLFDKLKIRQQIKYGTINEICSKILNPRGFQLRQEVLKTLKQPVVDVNKFKDMSKQLTDLKNYSTDSNHLPKNKILLIDQIDVFFSQDFYGKSYVPYMSVCHQTIQDLLTLVWNNRTKEISQIYSIVQNSNQLKNCIYQFPTLEKIIREAVKGMISAVRNWQHDYIIVDDRIAYIQQDGISLTANYGYKTTFAYYYECERDNISMISRNNAAQIYLTVGQLSYTELLKYYIHIVGVTGTLKTLTTVKQEILRNEYKINDNYFIPSAYNRSNLTHNGIKICKTENYFEEIIKQTQRVINLNRPVIIFFDSYLKANLFQISQQFRSLSEKCMILSQYNDQIQQEFRIYRSTIAGNITVSTRSFGRGTDFNVQDDDLNERGGLHIIQTFLSEEESEQIQIKGRTARQGAKGSYKLIIKQDQLEKYALQLDFDGQNHSIQGKTNSQEQLRIINEKRNKYYNQKQKRFLQQTNQLKQNHQRSMKMISNILNNQNSNVCEYVLSLNSFPELVINKQKVIKTVLGLDATGSMGQILLKTTSILGKLFMRAYEIIKLKNISASFQIQIAVYRNYNSPIQQIFLFSPFESQPENLIKILKTIEARDGWGNQAIQVLYDHINQTNNIDQVIIIGDAPCNTFIETKTKIKEKGQKYWLKTKLKKPLNSDEQLKKIIDKQIPIHSAYVLNPYLKNQKSTKEYFQRLSKVTGGVSQQFKPDQNQAQNKLTDFIVTNILNKIGGEQLVNAYQQIYMQQIIRH